MATEREYLISIGLAKTGRGRFSAEAKQALAKARNDGMTFDSPAVPAPTNKRIRVERKPREPRAKKGIGVIELRPRTLAQDAKVYHTTDGGKRLPVSDRNICGSCGVSLSHHSCSNPTALVRGVMGYVPVTIE